MIKGLYTSAMGMLVQEASLEVATNNLANINTAGYKKDRITFEEFPNILKERLNDTPIPPGQTYYTPPLIGRMGSGIILDRVTTDHEEGHLTETANPLDLALQGKAWFALETKNGTRLTKDGKFHLDQEGYISASRGNRLLTVQAGINPVLPALQKDSPSLLNPQPIRLDNALETDISISETGEIFLRGESTGRQILSVQVKNTNQLKKEGYNLLKLNEGEALFNRSIPFKQGFMELSNVNVVTEMVQMIKISRAYEANSKILTSIDEKIGQAVREVGQFK